jgi:peptidoglycan/xylan/chitin deacetylase (PgdA/CDA1 family)
MKIKNKLKNIFYRMISPWPFFAKGAIVLMYHSIGANDRFFTVKPADFEEQMSYLHRQRFNVVSLATLEQYLKQGDIPVKTIVLTFDDGYEDNFSIAWPILRKYNFPATIFLATDLPAKTDQLALLNSEQMKALATSGLIDFEPHTAHHLKLTKIDLTETEQEIVSSREAIDNRFTKKSAYFAYPHGRYNNQIAEMLKKLGFRLGFTVEKGVVRPDDNKILLKRNAVDSAVTMAQFKAMVKLGKI